MTRVLTVIDSLLAGGAERVAVQLACELDRTRFSPHVLVTRCTGPLHVLLDDAQVPYTVLDRARAVDLRAMRRALRVARDSDLIHAHKFGSNAWGAWLSRRAGIPLVTHEHNFSDTPSRLRSFINRRYIATRSQRVLCVSETVADTEREQGISDSLLRVMPNAVELDVAIDARHARAELGIDHASTLIGIVARLRPEKAHDVLIRAFADVVAAGCDVRLCIVGDGPCRAELKQLAAGLGVDQRITWAGERDNAARLAAAFDMSIICSHWEGMPLAALESMAAAVPVIATRVGALPELVADDAGILVAPGDVRALADAIRALVRDPSRAAALGAHARQRIADQYAMPAWIAQISDLYDSLAPQSARTDTTTDIDTIMRGAA